MFILIFSASYDFSTELIVNDYISLNFLVKIFVYSLNFLPERNAIKSSKI